MVTLYLGAGDHWQPYKIAEKAIATTLRPSGAKLVIRLEGPARTFNLDQWIQRAEAAVLVRGRGKCWAGRIGARKRDFFPKPFPVPPKVTPTWFLSFDLSIPWAREVSRTDPELMGLAAVNVST